MDNCKAGLGFLFGMLVGTLVGASIAVILAPASGQETRELLRRSADDWKSRATDFASELKEDTGEWVERTRQKMGTCCSQNKAVAEEQG
jgi:gas vesicle protein